MAPSSAALRVLGAQAQQFLRPSGLAAASWHRRDKAPVGSVACGSYAYRRAMRELATLRETSQDGRTPSAPARHRPPSRGGRREPVRKGTVSPSRPVPDWIRRPPYVGQSRMPDQHPDVQVHSGEALRRVRRACALAARVLEAAGRAVDVGVATDEIDEVVHEATIAAGAYPSPPGYGGFPKSVCTSVNEVVCHGIPDSRPLREGDIVNVDVTVYLDGYHGDTSAMFIAGGREAASPAALEICDATLESLLAGIAVCGPGVPYAAIGAAIGAVATPRGFGLVDAFAGHGLGAYFHSAPTIYHVPNLLPGRMQVGETFTIEPMLTARSPEVLEWRDGWTAVTRDRGLSAQYEHAIVITEDGAEVLTRTDGDAGLQGRGEGGGDGADPSGEDHSHVRVS